MHGVVTGRESQAQQSDEHQDETREDRQPDEAGQRQPEQGMPDSTTEGVRHPQARAERQHRRDACDSSEDRQKGDDEPGHGIRNPPQRTVRRRLVHPWPTGDAARLSWRTRPRLVIGDDPENR